MLASAITVNRSLAVLSHQLPQIVVERGFLPQMLQLGKCSAQRARIAAVDLACLDFATYAIQQGSEHIADKLSRWKNPSE